MKPRGFSVLALAPASAVFGAVVATLGVSDPASRVAVLLLALGGILLTMPLSRLAPHGPDRRFLRGAMLHGVGLRLLVFAVIHQTVGPYVFAPDQWTYEARGLGLLNFWRGVGPLPTALEGSLQYGYPALNAVVFAVFGQAKAAPAVLNIFFSSWTAIPVFALSLLLVRENRAVAKIASALTVLFPSLVLWSVLNIREAPAILLVATAVYFAARLQLRPGFGGFVGAVVALGLLALFREYLTVLVGAGAVAGILMGRSDSPVRAFIAGSVLLAVLTVVSQRFGLGQTLSEEPTLGLAQSLRRGFLFNAESAYGQGADISTAGGALRFLPIGLMFFLFAPFPWSITSTLQAITVPETLVWYALIPLGAWGALLALRHEARSFTVPLAVLVAVTVAYALVEGNVGTAYRHRAQILPIAFVFCALGVRDVQAIWLGRRGARTRRRRELADRLAGTVRRGTDGS